MKNMKGHERIWPSAKQEDGRGGTATLTNTLRYEASKSATAFFMIFMVKNTLGFSQGLGRVLSALYGET